jgi:hypothetical protein
MADPIEPLPESEKDLTGEFRKDLRAVEALQRYFGTAPNRPASNARVVSAGDASAQAPEESSPYNPTDFLGLNAEIESLLSLPPDSAQESAPVRTDTLEEETAEGSTPHGERPSWLLELDEQRANAQGAEPVVPGSQDPRELPRATALDASFVEPEGHKERTWRVFFPVLGAAATVAALFAAWKLTTEAEHVDDGSKVAVAVRPNPSETQTSGPSTTEGPSERWALLPDGSRQAVPVGSPELGETATTRTPDVARMPEETVTPTETVAEVTPDEFPAETESEAPVDGTPESSVSGSEASEVLTALDELADTPTGEPEHRMPVWASTTPFPWPSTLVSVLMDRQVHGLGWQTISDLERFTPVDVVHPTSGASISPADRAAASAVSSIEVSADELARWMLLGPPDESALEGASVAGANRTGQPKEDALASIGAGESFSTLRRARSLATNHWWGHEVPEHLIGEPRQVFTPDVGRVRVTTEAGEIFIGRLAWVGNRMLSLEAETGSLTLRSLAVRRIERLMEPTKPKTLSPSNDLTGLAEVRVAVPGGHLVGRLLEQDGSRVTLLTEEGGRVTVQSDSVEPVRGEHALALISGRAPQRTSTEE